ncbi:MAG: purine-nucleoside phosphorylase [Terriglobales bacterium]
MSEAEEAAQYLLTLTPLRPKIAVVLGSGLGCFADELSDAVRVPYEEIPDFPHSTVAGHPGNLVLGKLGEITLAVLQGRVHLYEGFSPQQVTFPLRALGRMGICAIVLTSAAGGINPRFQPGSLVVIEDHINLQRSDPLAGPELSSADLGAASRFVDLTKAYDKPYRELALREARNLGVQLFTGVYAAMPGPSYETPAEIRYLRVIGADLVGMSIAQEVIAARHMGLKVLAISCITNMAAGILDQPITHEEVLQTAKASARQLTSLLRAVIPHLMDEPNDGS